MERLSMGIPWKGLGWGIGMRKEGDQWNAALRRVWRWQIPSSCNIYGDVTRGRCLETELETRLTTSWSGGSTRTKQSIGRLIQRQM
jgi:hypothetical protein